MPEPADPSFVESVVDAAEERMQELPASAPAPAPAPAAGKESPPPSLPRRFFNRERSLHEMLGGGKPADVLLWRHKYLSAGILAGATTTWFLFEKSGYTLLTVASNALLALITVLFVWSNAAAFLNRSPPPIPELHLSEDMVASFALSLRDEINKALAVAHDIALGKDFKMFLKVIAVLWGLSVVGGWFHFLTLLYICIVLGHTIPVIYENYEDRIDGYAKLVADHTCQQYRKIDETILSRIGWSPMKQKKTQ